jgi:hypothetical protein
VWQGVPYLFADSLGRMRHEPPPAGPVTRTAAYRVFLAFLAFPPLLLLLYQSPLAIVVMYAIAGSFFMPFLAGVLLVMNNRRDWVGSLKNGPVINGLLLLSLVLFAVLFVVEAAESLARL